MKTNKTNSPLPSGGRSKTVIKKVIILFITIMISLSILLMPCLVSSKSILYEPSQVSAAEVDLMTKYKNTTISNFVHELEGQGYSNVQWLLAPLAKMEGINFSARSFDPEEMKTAVLRNYIFTVEYVSTALNENTIYYFKTAQESDNFIKEINKYGKIEFTISKVQKSVGEETSSQILEEAIASAKKAYEERIEAEKRAAAQRKASYSVSMGDIALDNPIVAYAVQFNGNPYVSGGTSLTNGTDCSGFTQSIYKHFGVSIPRTASAQASVGQYVPFDQLQPGDLVFYSGNGGASITHVALYVGGGQIIHARTPAKGIGITTANIMVKMTARRVI